MEGHGEYYFGYGSNLYWEDWEKWCARRGCVGEGLRIRGTGCLPDWDIVFHYRSTSRQGGALDIMPRTGQIVEGAIFEVDDRTWKALNRKEGAGQRYERIGTVALDERGREIPVVTYRVRKEHQTNFVRPTDDYLKVVEQGLAAFGLSSQTLRAAARGERPPLIVDGLFVYGTLLQGEMRWPVLRKYGVTSVKPARAAGQLFDLGNFPGMILSTAPSHVVHGEFVQVEDLSAALERLDIVEGFHGFGEPESLFRRTVTRVTLDDGTDHRAWVYEFARSPDGSSRISSGDWRVRGKGPD